MEFLNWIRDVGSYLKMGMNRGLLPKLGRGIDYTDPRYRDLVREVVSRIHPERMELELTEIVEETRSTRTFRFKRTDDVLPPFRAGQYVNLFVEVQGVLTSRPYSISSPPGTDLLDLTVRDRPGGFVAPYLLASLEVGQLLGCSGPAGSFYHEPLIDGDDLVFLAGGSGITPFISIIRDQERRGWPLRIHLLYGSRTPDDVIFGEELARMADASKGFTCSLVISEPPEGYQGPTGLLDKKTIEETVGQLQGRTFYICGPRPMQDLCLEELARLGVPEHKIRRELYGPPDDVTREPGWPEAISAEDTFEVEVEGHRSIQARAGEPLLCSMERAGIAAPALCRSGECSACRCRLVSGRVFMPENTGLRDSDRRHGYVHACVAYPLEDLKLRI